MIAAERNRQIKEEGYSADMDDKHTCGDLADAAAIYAMSPDYRKLPLANDIGFKDVKPFTEKNEDGTIFGFIWPCNLKYYKPAQYKTDTNTSVPETEVNINLRIRELAKAGALIAAEIDRLFRILSKKSRNE